MKKIFRMPPPIAILMGLCALLMFAACDSSGESDADVSDDTAEEVEVEVTGTDITTDKLTNADFESNSYDGWTVSVSDGSGSWGDWDIKNGTSENNSGNTTYYLHIGNYNDASTGLTATATQSVTLDAGSYIATIDAAGVTGSSELVFFAANSDGDRIAFTNAFELSYWATWITYEIEFELTEQAEVTLGVNGTLASSAYCYLDNLKLYLIEE